MTQLEQYLEQCARLREQPTDLVAPGTREEHTQIALCRVEDKLDDVEYREWASE